MKQLAWVLLGAWIVWARAFSGNTDWDAVTGFPTYEQCEKAADGMRRANERGEKKPGWIRATYECFPDITSPG